MRKTTRNPIYSNGKRKLDGKRERENEKSERNRKRERERVKKEESRMRGNSSGALTFKCRRGRRESGTSADHEGREGGEK